MLSQQRKRSSEEMKDLISLKCLESKCAGSGGSVFMYRKSIVPCSSLDIVPMVCCIALVAWSQGGESTLQFCLKGGDVSSSLTGRGVTSADASSCLSRATLLRALAFFSYGVLGTVSKESLIACVFVSDDIVTLNYTVSNGIFFDPAPLLFSQRALKTPSAKKKVTSKPERCSSSEKCESTEPKFRRSQEDESA